jgi:non-lysosomal glucosylceramidase
MKKQGRRGFLKNVALAGGAAASADAQTSVRPAVVPAAAVPCEDGLATVAYPRKFTGRKLGMLAFPLGGVGAGSIALGGRGQLRDWEIFNRSEKGKSPAYAFPAIWVQAGDAKPVAHVLEARIVAPFEGRSGLGADNAPGLSRLESATFTGEYPLATVAFHDPKLPVDVTLEAFSPFVPLDAEGSGLPVAVMRYRVHNPGKSAAKVAIAFAIDNPVIAEGSGAQASALTRVNEFKTAERLAGVFMHNPPLDAKAPRAGSFALCVMDPEAGRVSHLSGWPKAKWWTSPLLYWDDFSTDGMLGPEKGEHNGVGSLCLQRTVAGGAETEFTFLLAWHFPNRTPVRMGWNSDAGQGDTKIGNYYCRRFNDAWHAALYAAQKLPELEERMRQFLTAIRETTMPAAVKEAAMANASTLASTSCFRTEDGRFFGWEGSGCCHGNCDHVWNYETTTHHLFPSLARSMRETHLELSSHLDGAMPIRVNLPLDHQTDGAAAADGQMGQIVKAYFDWQLSGDGEWLRKWWPAIKKALEFSWVPGGWDADRDGVFEGVQHNTYDVEFYGPNPMCGIYYLAALRAGEEMARAMGETGPAGEYRKLFDQGRKWIDDHLFNGEYYVQQVRGMPKDQIAKGLIAGMGAEDTAHPDYQLGDGCLVDQLVGQHAAEYAGLGPLVSTDHIRKTLQSIYKYNYKRTMSQHDNVQRTFALNDEAALVICDYGKGTRPQVPFPYFAEVMTGFEYSAATLMIAYGMAKEGVECIENIRKRYDGERRNPWDESECGPHYARAMAAWTAIPLLSGFRYRGPEKRLVIATANMKSFWSTGTGWGSFTMRDDQFSVSTLYGTLPLQVVELASSKAGASSVTLAGRAVAHTKNRGVVRFNEALVVAEGQELKVRL